MIESTRNRKKDFETEEVVFKVDRLGKLFKIYNNPADRLREWFSIRRRNYHNPFWAVQDISFELRKGQFLGIIGVNGAGKSTILKLLTGLIELTTGTIQSKGKVLSLLDLGGGLSEDLTGRQYVMRIAEQEGFPENYIKEKLPEIEAFAGIGEFFDHPIRTYSKGMRLRATFSAYVFLDCDILILDEVLAVGDIFFHQKCYSRLDQILSKGTSIILVSHALRDVQEYCDEVIVIHEGKKIYHGEPREALRIYSQLRESDKNIKIQPTLDDVSRRAEKVDSLNLDFPLPEEHFFSPFRPETIKDETLIKKAQLVIVNSNGRPANVFYPGETFVICCEFDLAEEASPICEVRITDRYNRLIHSKNSIQANLLFSEKVPRQSRLRFCFAFNAILAPAKYVLGIMFWEAGCAQSEDNGKASVANRKHVLIDASQAAMLLIMKPVAGQRMKHGGLVDLPSQAKYEIIRLEDGQ